jgi:hypothetical protein
MKLQLAVYLFSLAGLSVANPAPVNNDVIIAFQPQDCPLPEKLEWEQDYRFKDGNGHSKIIFRDNGDVRFQGRFRATSPLALDYSLSCALRDRAGNVYNLSRKGTMKGTAAQGNTESVFEEVKNHAGVRNHWWEILKGGKMHCSAKTNVDVKDTLKEVTGLIGQYGPLNGEIVILI